MEQSQLIELINNLKPDEKEEILQFASIPFFNQGRMKAQVVPLLNFCLNHPWQEHKEGSLEKRQVFISLFPDQEFVEGKLEKIMVEAHKIIRSFLLVKKYFRKENEFNIIFDFAEIVRTRGLNSRYPQLLTKLKKIQDEAPLKNAPFFHRQFLLEYAIHDEESFYNQKRGYLNIPNTINALEIYHHINQMALLNRFLLQQKVANLEIPDSMKVLFEKEIMPENYLKESPFLLIQYTIFNLLKKKLPDPSDASVLFSLLQIYESNLDSESLIEFYTYLRNICVLILISNPDHEEINFTLHELYKDNLKRGYLHYEGKLHPSRYLAISENAARVKKYDWALEFIEKHKNEIIGENETRDIYRLNLANYFFGIGKFSECLDHIPANSPFVDYMLTGKRLELKALYELQSDLFSYKLDAFKMFLSRTSQKLLSETQRQPNIDFANLLTQIASSRSGDQNRASRIIKRIQENKKTAEWRWLLTKAEALKGK